MDNILIVGGGGHAKVVISIIKKTRKYHVVGYTDLVDKGIILSVPYIGDDSALPEFRVKHEVDYAIVGVGHVRNADARKKIVEQTLAAGFRLPALISPQASVNENVTLGDGTVVMDGVVINSDTVIGKFGIINTRSIVEHDCIVGDFVHVGPGAVLCGGVTVGNNTLVGAGSTVVQNLKIGSDCLIGAGSVVVDHCTEPGTYVGIPSRKQVRR